MKSVLQYMGWRRIALEALRRDGIVVMPPFPKIEFDDTLKHIKTDNVVTAPWFFETCLSMYDIAKNYFKFEPMLWNMTKEIVPAGTRLKWWQPFEQPYRELVILIYGTDVNLTTDGAFVYHPGTHTSLAKPVRPETILGLAGTVFLYDPAGSHMLLESSKEQLLLRSVWRADLGGSQNLDASTALPSAFLGRRYPRSPVLQKAIFHVVA